MKEEKLDRVIRKIVNDHFTPEPSREFVDNVMHQLGVKPGNSALQTKPLKPKKGLILMGIFYAMILLSIFLIPGALESSPYKLPEFKLPSIVDYISIGKDLSKMLILLILGGWILLFSDRFLRKFFIS